MLAKILVVLLALQLRAGSAAQPLPRNGAEIQRVADSLPRGDGVPNAGQPIGGTIHLPAGDIYVTEAIRLGSEVHLVGQGRTATRLIYTGTGPAIRIASYINHGVHAGGSISDLAIYTVAGDGVGYDASATVSENFTIERCTFNVGGTAINLVPPTQDDRHFTYQPAVRDTNIAFAGSRAIDFWGRMGAFERVRINNPARALPETRPSEMMRFVGTGSLRDSWIEGPWKTTFLFMKGDWTLANNHIEPSSKGIAQIVFAGHEKDQMHAVSIIIDRPSMVQPQYPIEIRGQVTVTVLSPDIGIESNDGDTRRGLLPKLEDCFKVDPRATLLHQGKRVAGRELSTATDTRP